MADINLFKNKKTKAGPNEIFATEGIGENCRHERGREDLGRLRIEGSASDNCPIVDGLKKGV